MKKNTHKKNKRIYLDYASSTPIDTSVYNILTKTTKTFFGNPSALYHEGQQSKKLIEDSIASIAKLFDIHTDEIIFTSGGTESDTLAIQGIVRAIMTDVTWKNRRPHILVSAIEHAAVLETVKQFVKQGIDVTLLPVTNEGIVEPKSIRQAITPHTILVSIMYANNEIGTIQPIREIAKEIRHARKKNKSSYPYFHTDAAQAINYLPIRIPALGIDMLTASSSKLYGPKGIGMLYLKRGVPVAPILFGGNQQQGLRPGTESAPLIAAFAKALEITEKIKEKETLRLLALKKFLTLELLRAFPSIRRNGSAERGLPNILNVTFPGFTSELLVIELDAKGISVSAKSACKSDDPEISHVLAAIGRNTHDEGSIRIALGRSTTKNELIHFIESLKTIFAKYTTVRKKS
jgi:cysteine desulfurase